MGRLRLVAFVAALALLSGAILPMAHATASHTGDCGVCSTISHGGSGVADSAPILDLPAVAACPELESIEPAQTAPHRDFDVPSARAPPAVSVTA